MRKEDVVWATVMQGEWAELAHFINETGNTEHCVYRRVIPIPCSKTGRVTAHEEFMHYWRPTTASDLYWSQRTFIDVVDFAFLLRDCVQRKGGKTYAYGDHPERQEGYLRPAK